jgi:hypothetical protein
MPLLKQLALTTILGLSLALSLSAAPAAGRPAPRPQAVVAVELPPGAALAAAPAPTAAPLPSRQLPTGETYEPLPGFGAPALAGETTLLREGMLRGRRIAVYAVAEGGPSDGELAAALAPGARPVRADELARLDRAPFATGGPPPDPRAAAPAWKLTAAETGMQSVSAGALAAAGLNLAAVNPASLRLFHRGREVGLEEVRDGSGALTGLRFYAEPGDRWNSTAVYWLVVGQAPQQRIATRNAAPAGAPVTTTAVERGAWRTNSILETRLAGPDGDRFFSAELRTAPIIAGEPTPPPAVVTATISPRLPVATGEAALTLSGDSLFEGGHTVRATLGQAQRTAQWTGRGPWSARLTFPAGAAAAPVALLPAATVDGVHLDSAAWELPVRLELGGSGARFEGRAGRLGYRMTGLPPDAAVYDVSDPAWPVRLTFSGDTFEDGGAEPRRYLVRGPGTLHTPTVAAHTPVDLSRPLDVEAVYIAPREFLDELEPLLQHRRRQGLNVAALSTEAIYDSWSYGQVDPEAIRSFLRFAAERWQAAPTTVVLVGDGSSDPRNYLGRNGITRVPPYLALADPWLGETACDSCYARLHGADPLLDTVPDLTFGRIPAKSGAELAALVAKILAYETFTAPSAWRGTLAFVADNPDLGGDFIAASQATAGLQPEGARLARVYFDPAAEPDDPLREEDPLRALARTVGLFDAGAAVLQYTGHGLQFQWGYTGPPLRAGEPTDRQYLLNVFTVDELRNGPKLPVVLSMTCLTGSFQIPAFSGTAIDERLVARADGGAIAAWSSTGLGVLFGHEALQRGFYTALWAAPGEGRLGELTMAGYAELFAASACCQETISTFVLLGDPLTVPRVDVTAQLTHLPLVRR